MQDGARRFPPKAWMLVVFASACLVYAGTLSYGFVWDDHALIEYRAHLFGQGRLPELLGSEFFAFTPQRTHYYRPLVTLTFLLDYLIWGLRPFGFHLTNLLVHASVSAGVFLLGRRLGNGTVAGMIAGILFALHPVHVESVAFISGRTDLLAGFFFVGTLLAHGQARAGGSGVWTLISAMLFLLGLASKETVVLLPLLLLAMAWAQADDGSPVPWRSAVQGLWLHLVALSAYLALRAMVLGRLVNESATPWADMPTRLLTSIRLATTYAQVALVPVPERIFWVVGHDVPPPSAGWWVAAGGLGVLLGLTVLACLRWRRAGFACLVFWLALAPAVGINLLPVAKEIAAERFLYLPSIGVCLLGGLIGQRIQAGQGFNGRGLRAGLGILAAGTVLVFLAVGTWLRSRAWREDHTLTSRMVETSPEARIPRQNLGLSHLRRGEFPQALTHLRKAVELGSASTSLQATLGLVEAALGMGDLGLRRALAAARQDPDDPTIAALVADVYRVRGEPAEALGWLDTSLRINPWSLEAGLNRAAVLVELGRYGEAKEALARIAPGLPAKGTARLTHARIEAELDGRLNPRGSADPWIRYAARLRALPQRTSAQERDLAYAERKIAEAGQSPGR